MRTIDRNGLVDALLTRLLDANLQTVTRRLRDPQVEEMPALIVGATTEQRNNGEDVPDWTLVVGCMLFVHEEGEAGPIPALLGAIDAIEGALRRPAEETHGGFWTNLGGLAWYARPLSVDSLPDLELADGGVATVRVEIRARPVI